MCFSQNNSFQLVLDSVDYKMHDIAVNEEGEIMLFIKKFYINLPDNALGLYLLPVEGSGGTVQGVEIFIRSSDIIRSEYRGDRIVFLAYGASYPIPNTATYTGKSIIMSIDLASNARWIKYLNGQIRDNKFSMDKNGHVIIANTPFSIFDNVYYNDHVSVFELFKLDEAGNTVWKKGLLFLDSLSAEMPDASITDLVLDEESNIYVLGECGNFFSSDEKRFPYIIKFDSTGQPLLLKTLAVKNQTFNEMEITPTGILLLSHAPNNPGLFGAGAYQKKYARLLKLDFDLNLLWGKEYSGEHFPYYSAGIKEKPNGNLLMTHATFGAYPAVLTEMDAFGNILSEKGYPNYQPQIAVLNDGSFLMTSVFNYNDAGETFYQPVIAKTDTNGEIEGCVNYPACIEAEDYTVEFGTFNYDTISIPDLEAFDTLVQPVNFSFTEFCGFPPAPQPDFDFPDSLCLGESGTTSNTRNLLANAREWHLTGPGVDSVLADSLNFSYSFSQAGEYLLGQTVWMLGCAYMFKRAITVLPPLEAAIHPDRICPDAPTLVSVNANRPISSYTWSNGQATPTLAVTSSGNYAVTVSDSICTTSSSTTVTVVAELMDGQPALTLPPDTVICDTELPYVLLPSSHFTDSFFLLTELHPAESFQLAEAGQYRIGVEVFKCLAWEDFNLGLDCHADVFVPNAFSPNNDGFNDLFQPFGTNFEVREMVVYDRWGGEMFRSEGASAAWDGKDAGQGLYVYKIRYLNLLSGRIEELGGDVVLIK